MNPPGQDKTYKQQHIDCRGGVGMKGLEIVSMIKVNGKWENQDEMNPEEVAKIIEDKFDQTMKTLHFEREKIA